MSSVITKQWADIDGWWDDHVEYHSHDLEVVSELIEQSNILWAANESIFTQDPLCESWESQSPMAGPLRTNQEENWSQWIAHLIRSSDGRFSHELFGVPEQSTASVDREIHMSSQEHHDRRVDIIVDFPELSCSIELKKGDEHYEKSSEAAYLVEANADHDRQWTHYLLVPELKRPAVVDAFGDDIDLSGTGTPTIYSEAFVDIEILWWKDVAAALRRAITAETNENWQASAYLFITLVEQKIMQLYSQSTIEQISAGGNVSDLASVRSVDIDDQIEYLRSSLEGLANE